MSLTIYMGNTSIIELSELKDSLTVVYLNSATVIVTLLDDYGEEVGGQVWPLAMDYVTDSDGTYRATLSSGLDLVANKKYKAVMQATFAGNTAQWRCNVFSKVRTCCDEADCNC